VPVLLALLSFAVVRVVCSLRNCDNGVFMLTMFTFPFRSPLGLVSDTRQQGNGRPSPRCALVPVHASTVAGEGGRDLREGRAAGRRKAVGTWEKRRKRWKRRISHAHDKRIIPSVFHTGGIRLFPRCHPPRSGRLKMSRTGSTPPRELPGTARSVICAVVVTIRYEGSGSPALGCWLSRSRSPAYFSGLEIVG
jgi:hypothetical protein